MGPDRKLPTDISFVVTFYLYHCRRSHFPSKRMTGRIFSTTERGLFSLPNDRRDSKSKGFGSQGVHTPVGWLTCRKWTQGGVVGVFCTSPSTGYICITNTTNETVLTYYCRKQRLYPQSTEDGSRGPDRLFEQLNIYLILESRKCKELWDSSCLVVLSVYILGRSRWDRGI